MKTTNVKKIVVIISIALSTPALSQVGGGVPVRISVGTSAQCINGSKDRVWLTMYRVIVTKKDGFLTKEKEALVVAKVSARTEPAAPQALVYPLSSKVEIGRFAKGQISLPVEYTLVSGLPLSQKDSAGKAVSYTGFGVETTVVNLKGRNGLGVALDTLLQITGSGKIPIPTSPLAQGAGYLLNFANAAVTKDIERTDAADKATTSTLALNFDPTGKCSDGLGSPVGSGPASGFERVGVKAIVMANGAAGDALVPLGQISEYCWSADLEPSLVIKAGRKNAAKACDGVAYKAISNDYVAFFLQSRPIASPETTLGPGTSSQEAIERAKRESGALCNVLKVKNCPAAQ